MSRKIFEIIIDEDITPPGKDELMGLNPYSRVMWKFKHNGELYGGETVIDAAFLPMDQKQRAAALALDSAFLAYAELEK